MAYEILRYLHILGATVLIGTGAGIAFFMVMAHRTGNAEAIASVARIVVTADFVFTATAVVLQPLTGLALVHHVGWSLWQGWLLISLALYLVIGLCWLPVVWIQMELRKEAEQAVAIGELLSPRYHKFFKLWLALGVPAFTSILALLWLMVAKPEF